MRILFDSGFDVPGDPQFKYLVNLDGALVPLAQIKAIGLVEDFTLYRSNKDLDGKEIEEEVTAYRFPVSLGGSEYLDDPDEPAIRPYYDTKEEAETQRRNLALQLETYYKQLTSCLSFMPVPDGED